MKFETLVEICFWLNLAVRGLINIKEPMQLIIESKVLMASGPIFRPFPYSLSLEIFVVTFLWVVDFKLFFKTISGGKCDSYTSMLQMNPALYAIRSQVTQALS